MADKPYRVAVIGRTGKGNYGHGLDTVWLGLPNVEIVAVADENEPGRAAAAKRLKVTNTYADYREMLDKEKPQIVSVADRFLDSHAEMVIACAGAGASVFLEKPMARTLQEADAMIEACERAHVKGAIAHQTRYSPRLEVVRKLIADDRIGDVLEIRGRGKEDKRGGGNDLMVLGSHVFDLMRLLVGDARWCHATIWQDDRPATMGDVREGGEMMGPVVGNRITASFGFDKNILGTFGTHVARYGSSQRFGLVVYGSKGMIALGTGSLPLAFLSEDASWGGRGNTTWQPISSAGLGVPEPLPNDGMTLGNRLIVQDLMRSIEEDRQPLGSLYDGRAALEMILAIYESFRQQRPVELPLKNRRHPLNA